MANLKELLGDSYKEDMTFADIEKVLSAKNLADLSTGEYVSKGKFSENEKKYKELEKKYNEKLSDEEKQIALQQERDEYVKGLEKQLAKTNYYKKLSQTIKDEKALNEIVDLYSEGKMVEAFEKQNTYFESERERIIKETKDEAMKTNPTPNNSGSAGGSTKKFSEMSIEERIALKESNPEEYESQRKSSANY